MQRCSDCRRVMDNKEFYFIDKDEDRVKPLCSDCFHAFNNLKNKIEHSYMTTINRNISIIKKYLGFGDD